MQITRNGQPVPFTRASAPHLSGANTWHGDFTLPEPPASPHPVQAQFGQAAIKNPHDSWLDAVVSVEFTALPSIPVKVSAAKVVAVGGNRIEWEGEADA